MSDIGYFRCYNKKCGFYQQFAWGTRRKTIDCIFCREKLKIKNFIRGVNLWSNEEWKQRNALPLVGRNKTKDKARPSASAGKRKPKKRKKAK